MKAILSIKPQFATLIFDGDKKFEYRKTVFRKPVETIVVYASAPTSKVVGEFKIDGVVHKSLECLWKDTKHQAGISKEYFFSYFADKKKGYAIRIVEAVRYEKPIRIEEAFGVAPPQSFRYL